MGPLKVRSKAERLQRQARSLIAKISRYVGESMKKSQRIPLQVVSLLRGRQPACLLRRRCSLGFQAVGETAQSQPLSSLQPTPFRNLTLYLAIKHLIFLSGTVLWVQSWGGVSSRLAAG